MIVRQRTQVGIVGAGRAGLLAAHLAAAAALELEISDTAVAELDSTGRCWWR